MANVGYDNVWPKICPTVFIVRNIAPGNKTVRVFGYPIRNGQVRDLMAIPYVSEADIRHALLKGNLRIKFEHEEIIVVSSNIDLLQFDECHKDFLESIGITIGLDIDGAGYSATQEGEVLYSKDSSTFSATLPLTSDQGWLVNDQGILLFVH